MPMWGVAVGTMPMWGVAMRNVPVPAAAAERAAMLISWLWQSELPPPLFHHIPAATVYR